jgi:phosphomannomutase
MRYRVGSTKAFNRQEEPLPARDPIKVYDARWETHEFEDDAIVRLFESTYAYGRRLGVDTVTLARDGRMGAAHVLELAADTAVRMGLRVYLCPESIGTPQGYFLALHVSREHPATMGLMVTASHNPRQYIGVKFTVPTVQAIGEDCGPMGGLSAVREIYHSPETFGPVSGGSLRIVNVAREYVEFSMAQAGIGPGDLSGISVVLDGFHGSAGPEVMTALQRAGARVEALRLVPDGRFPTGSPNPTSQGKMQRAVAMAAERDSLAVIGLDGDGDRVVFGDRRGILSAGFAAVPILRTCVREQGAQPLAAATGGAQPLTALYDPKVNPLALREWGNLHIRPVLFRNGHSQIKDYMRRTGAVAAAEESGHYYHRFEQGGHVVCCENSIVTVLLFLGAVKAQPGLLDELWSMQSAVRTTGEFNYQFPDDEIRDRALSAVLRRFVAQSAAAVTATLDGIDLQGTVVSKGVRIDDAGVHLEPGWYSGSLRVATNEKGVVRSYFSCADSSQIERIERDVRRILGEEYQGAVID